MKYKYAAFLITVILIFSFLGCAKQTSNEAVKQNQKIMVVVCDKESKRPIKDTKVYILGNSDVFTTDEMGKTPEIQVEVNSDYFNKYIDDVSKRMRGGFVNLVALKEGYGKHMELDYNIYPGSSIYLVKVWLTKGSKNTMNINEPDKSIVEDIARIYENFEGTGLNTGNMVKYNVTVTDELGKPIEGAKVIVPEAQFTSKTNNKGICKMDIPYDNSEAVGYPVKKEYGEITIIANNKGYSSMVVLRAPVNKDGKDNNIRIKLIKTDKQEVKYEILKPNSKWVNEVMDFYK